MKKLIHFANNPKYVLIAFVVNIVAVAIIYALIESVSVSDGLWWAVVTASTVGYGDISPATTGGQLLASYFILSNFIILGPLIIATVLLRLIEDKNEFTDSEQRALFSKINELEKKVDQLSRKK